MPDQSPPTTSNVARNALTIGSLNPIGSTPRDRHMSHGAQRSLDVNVGLVRDLLEFVGLLADMGAQLDRRHARHLRSSLLETFDRSGVLQDLDHVGLNF